MALGLGKIPGHSGTEFKHRKVFKNRKRRHENSKIDFEQTTYSRTFKQKNNLSKLIKLIALCIGIIGLFLICKLAIVSFDADEWKVGSQKDYATSFSDYEEAKNNEAFQFLVKSGNQQLVLKNFDAAEREFSRAIAIKRVNKSAYIGLTKIFIEKCDNQNIYCTRAKEYIDFLEKSELLTKEELESLNKKLEAW